MNTHPFLAGLRQTPDYFLQNLDLVNGRGLVVRVSEAIYRESSFLDDRMFTPQMEGFWFPLDALQEATTELTSSTPPHYIFQIGHCGSTLISRLLAELPGNLPVREPMSLLTLAMTRRELDRPSSWVSEAQWQSSFNLATHLLARTYHPADRAIIKATSAAGNLLEVLLKEPGKSPQMLLMYLSLESFLAVMLRTPSLRDSVHAYSPAWISDFCRLTGRNDMRLADLDDAQQITVKWLTLMLLFTQAVSAAPAHVRLLNFDDFLKDPAQELRAITGHFRLSADPGNIEKLVVGPLMHSYSKIPAQNFNPGQRERELQEARARFHDEIQAGLRWAEELCREIPALEHVNRHMHNETKIA